MTTYQYNEFDFDEHYDTVTVKDIDDSQILEQYWNYWCEKMAEKYPGFKKDEMDFMSKSQCIEDWLVINWAWVKQ